MDRIKRTFRRLAGQPAGSASGDLAIPAAHGAVRVWFSNNVARFALYVPLPDASAAHGDVYRADTRPVVSAARPLLIRMRDQTGEDADHLASGIAREVQTGDAELDEEVYIDTECEEGTVRSMLTPEARAATLVLFRTARSALRSEGVIIDDPEGRVIAQWALPARATAELTTEDAQTLVSAMDRLAAALPPLRSTGPRSRQRQIGRLFPALNFVALGGVPVAVYAVATSRDPTDYLIPGLVGGGLLGVALTAAIYFFVRGRSDSPETRARAVVAALWLSLELGVIVARVLS